MSDVILHVLSESRMLDKSQTDGKSRVGVENDPYIDPLILQNKPQSIEEKVRRM